MTSAMAIISNLTRLLGLMTSFIIILLIFIWNNGSFGIYSYIVLLLITSTCLKDSSVSNLFYYNTFPAVSNILSANRVESKLSKVLQIWDCSLLISRLLYDHSTIVLTSVLLMVMSLIVQPIFIQPLHAQNDS